MKFLSLFFLITTIFTTHSISASTCETKKAAESMCILTALNCLDASKIQTCMQDIQKELSQKKADLQTLIARTKKMHKYPYFDRQATLSNETAKKLAEHVVSQSLKAQLDGIFQDEETQALFAAIYKDRGDATESKPIQNALKAKGVTFFTTTECTYSGYSQEERLITVTKFNVFSHAALPEYVFKMALPNSGFMRHGEDDNTSRIFTAVIDRQTIKEKGIKATNGFAVEIPKKQAYFFPQHKDLELPKVLVVADKVERDNPDRISANQITKNFSGLLSEINDDNIVINKSEKRLYIIDTGSRR